MCCYINNTLIGTTEIKSKTKMQPYCKEQNFGQKENLNESIKGTVNIKEYCMERVHWLMLCNMNISENLTNNYLMLFVHLFYNIFTMIFWLTTCFFSAKMFCLNFFTKNLIAIILNAIYFYFISKITFLSFTLFYKYCRHYFEIWRTTYRSVHGFLGYSFTTNTVRLTINKPNLYSNKKRMIRALGDLQNYKVNRPLTGKEFLLL